MNKQFFLLSFVVVAISTLTVGCQKETGTVTLGAEIQKTNIDEKTYISGHTPCWQNGDRVYINDAVYPVMAASGSSAQIENVTENSSYRAIYPASIVVDDYILNGDINSSAIIPINLPAVQNYQTAGGNVKTEVPMGAYLTSGNRLQFYNLCSIVRITISNSLNTSLNISSIVLRAENARLSGAGTATVNGQSSNSITMASSASHEVTLAFPNSPAYVGALQTRGSWDIVVPEFSTDNVTITINTTDGQFFTINKPNVQLQHNTITTVTVNVSDLNVDPTMPAILIDGYSFNNLMPDGARSVVFEYNSSVNSGTLLSTGVVPIYGNLDGLVWRVSTSASTINATDCYWMFKDKIYLRIIDFGSGFNTSNVTDMLYMFSGCSGLTSLDVTNFNTTNVTDMGMMFSDCSGLTSLDVTNFNTTNVTAMGGMFASCSGLTSLDVTNFNTTNVTNMRYMFSGCSGLTSLDVTNFNTTNVTDMCGMFSDCSGLTSLDVTNFNTTNVTYMRYMFSGCSGLTSLDLSSFNTYYVGSMSNMFNDCRNLTSLDLSHFDMSNVVDKSRMCSNLATTSRACTITCPLSVQTAMQSGTGLPTSGVTFTWVRP